MKKKLFISCLIVMLTGCFIHSEESTQNLFDAIKENNINKAQELIDSGIDVNAQAKVNEEDEFTQTPLLVAISNGKNEIAQLLLENGANPNARSINLDTPSEEGITPLIRAISKGDEQLVQLLLDSDANPNITLKT